jgi:hypothetical protein
MAYTVEFSGILGWRPWAFRGGGLAGGRVDGLSRCDVAKAQATVRKRMEYGVQVEGSTTHGREGVGFLGWRVGGEMG